MTISLAFLAPDLVKAAVEGRLPRGIGVTRLRDACRVVPPNTAMLGLSIEPGGLMCNSARRQDIWRKRRYFFG